MNYDKFKEFASVDQQKKQQVIETGLKPVICNTLDDVIRVIDILKAGHVERKSVSINTNLTYFEDDKKQMHVQNLNCKVNDSTLYHILIDGLNVVKNRIEVTDKYQKAIDEAKASGEDLALDNAKLWDINTLKFNVDDLIEKRLGGKRHGLVIRWVVMNGIFELDPYTMKFYQIEKSE